MVYIPRWQIILILVICVLGVIFAAPNLLDRTTAEQLPDWMPKQQMNLGLDLRGGSHLLLEVETQAVIKERLDGVADSVRTELRQAQVRFGDLRIDQPGASYTLQATAGSLFVISADVTIT